MTAVVATCNGRMMEKVIALAQMESKLLMIIAFLVGVIGALSGMITIFNNWIFR